jgi:hypothetical protein
MKEKPQYYFIGGEPTYIGITEKDPLPIAVISVASIRSAPQLHKGWSTFSKSSPQPDTASATIFILFNWDLTRVWFDTRWDTITNVMNGNPWNPHPRQSRGGVAHVE